MTKEIAINCVEDKIFEQDRKITRSCNRTFLLEKTNLFYVEALGYFDDMIGQYYTICPHCGYLVLIDENILSDNLKLGAKQAYNEDPYQYKKNSLKSQLIHLENMTPKVNAKVRVKTFY